MGTKIEIVEYHPVGYHNVAQLEHGTLLRATPGGNGSHALKYWLALKNGRFSEKATLSGGQPHFFDILNNPHLRAVDVMAFMRMSRGMSTSLIGVIKSTPPLEYVLDCGRHKGDFIVQPEAMAKELQRQI